VTNAAVQEKSKKSSRILRIDRPRAIVDEIQHSEGGTISAGLLLAGHRNKKMSAGMCQAASLLCFRFGPDPSGASGQRRPRVPFCRQAVIFSCSSGIDDALARGAKRGDQNMAFRKMRTAEHDQSVDEVEGEIREFVRREVVTHPGRQPENQNELVASNINFVLQRVTATSLQEIDKLITELESSRDMLQSEAARVQGEIIQYSTLSQAALQSTKIITESLTQLKKVPDAPTRSD
jgi:hypothetical protein